MLNEPGPKALIPLAFPEWSDEREVWVDYCGNCRNLDVGPQLPARAVRKIRFAIKVSIAPREPDDPHGAADDYRHQMKFSEVPSATSRYEGEPPRSVA